MFLNLRRFQEYNTPSFDDKGQLLVGAAVGTRQCDKERVKRLVEQGDVDLIVLDSSQGDSTFQGQMLEFIKTEYPSMVALEVPTSLRKKANTNGVTPTNLSTNWIV